MEITKQVIKYTLPLFFIFFISCSEQKKDVIKEELDKVNGSKEGTSLSLISSKYDDMIPDQFLFVSIHLSSNSI